MTATISAVFGQTDGCKTTKDIFKTTKRKRSVKKVEKYNIHLPGLFPCKMCLSTFATPRSLGGHTSKAHPGQSEDYQKKLQVRESRKPDRECLQAAKEQFKLDTGLEPELNRSRVTALKKRLLAERNQTPPEETLEQP